MPLKWVEIFHSFQEIMCTSGVGGARAWTSGSCKMLFAWTDTILMTFNSRPHLNFKFHSIHEVEINFEKSVRWIKVYTFGKERWLKLNETAPAKYYQDIEHR